MTTRTRIFKMAIWNLTATEVNYLINGWTVYLREDEIEAIDTLVRDVAEVAQVDEDELFFRVSNTMTWQIPSTGFTNGKTKKCYIVDVYSL